MFRRGGLFSCKVCIGVGIEVVMGQGTVPCGEGARLLTTVAMLFSFPIGGSKGEGGALPVLGVDARNHGPNWVMELGSIGSVGCVHAGWV